LFYYFTECFTTKTELEFRGVSHVIVRFDFIEVMHEKGEPLEQALLDAGIVRLRPVMITVGATILALFPLAIHGGPLWQPLCFAQIGGLSVATLYHTFVGAVFVLDLCSRPQDRGMGRGKDGAH
jgi:Cu/Ag efflux pump CusA